MTAGRRCLGAILAGGAATRMGGAAKGLERVAGARIVDHAAAALRAAADELFLVANADDAQDWLPGVPVARDRRTGFGALGGIHAALESTSGDVLVLAWDTPFVPGGLLRALRDAGELGDATMVVPRSASPWGFEPLCAWFSHAALEPVTALLDAGDGRVGALASRANVLSVDVSSWGDPDDLFFNVNTLADLPRAEAIAARLGAIAR